MLKRATGQPRENSGGAPRSSASTPQPVVESSVSGVCEVRAQRSNTDQGPPGGGHPPRGMHAWCGRYDPPRECRAHIRRVAVPLCGGAAAQRERCVRRCVRGGPKTPPHAERLSTVIWLILPAVICFVQGLSHARLSANGFQQWVCEWLLTSAVISVIECGVGTGGGPRAPRGIGAQLDILQNLVANTRRPRVGHGATLGRSSPRRRRRSRRGRCGPLCVTPSGGR